jgi:hypothetical protein
MQANQVYNFGDFDPPTESTGDDFERDLANE